MIRIFALSLLFFAFSAQAEKANIYYVGDFDYCESMSAEGAFSCLQKARPDLDMKMIPAESSLCDGGSKRHPYCVLTRFKGSDEEFDFAEYRLWISVRGKTCHSVENVLHNGESDGVHDVIPEMHYFRAPKGQKAKDYFPKAFDQCENNCMMHYHEYLFRKTQTGQICVKPPPEDEKPPSSGDEWLLCPSHKGVYKKGTEPTGDCALTPPKPKEPDEPKKPDNPGQPPKDDPKKPDNPNPPENPKEPEKPNDKKPGGGSGGGGGGGSGGKGSGDVDPSKPPEQPPESKPKPGGGGSGGGGGGGSGGSGGGDNQPKPPEQPQQPPNSGGGGSGGDKGKPGGDSGKDDDHGSPKGKDDGKGNDDKGDGKSSIGGGDCKANKAPICKGDPVQCYIAKEQWRTACLAERNGSSVSGGGDCSKPPQCKGDEAQCYVVKKQHEIACATQRNNDRMKEIDDFGNKHRKFFDTLDTNGDEKGITDSIGKDKIDLPKQFDTGIVRLPTQCPVIPPINMGIFGTAEVPTEQFCDFARTFGRIMLAITYIVAFGIIVRAT